MAQQEVSQISIIKPQNPLPDLFIDELYFSALIDDQTQTDFNPNFSISDDKYAEELQFQEAIMASLITPQTSLALPPPPTPTTTQEPQTTSHPELMDSGQTSIQIGESSQSFCEICVEKKEIHEMFRINKCSHSFCSDCITKHVAVKIQESVNAVTCPGLDCDELLEPESCKAMIPKEVIERWDEVLCESLIDGSQKFYCPFRDCSAMMVNDGEEVVREAECPVCRRLFCAQCYVGWHAGVECEEFMRLNEDERGREDLMVRELAREKNWMRCPFCKFYVDKTQGCLHMTCRCGFQFCYACGTQWSNTHGSCQPQ